MKPLPPPINSINGVWLFSRPPEFRAAAVSTPGHLLHFILEGEYLLRKTDGEYQVRANDVIHYFESEELQWVGGPSGVDFISVCFMAEALPPLPSGRQVIPNQTALRPYFVALHESWANEALPLARQSHCHGALYPILSALFPGTGTQPAPGHEDEPWLRAEAAVRRQRQFRPSLDELCTWAACSRITLIRSCRRVTGDTPIARIRHLRLVEAQGLLRYSGLNITQIAHYLGYPRIHEFSRDFSMAFSLPPGRYRSKKP